MHKKANTPVVAEGISVVAWGWEWQRKRDGLQTDVRKLSGLMNMLTISIVVMVSLVCTYVKTHSTVVFKYVQFSVH